MFEFALEKKLWSATGEMTLRVNQQLEPGSFLTVYGKSGAGKTSLLRILAGLMQPEAGRICVQQMLWLDVAKGVNRAPKDRQVGFLFQDYALFPNMTVLENLRFALPKQRQTRGGRSPLISDLIEIMELGELRHRKPATLSGGQQQRVALARALVQQPKLLMLDEPLSALDDEMRLRLQQYILQVHREFGLTTILVSHDLAEIWRLSDQVWVLEQGQVIRQGTAAEVFAGSKHGHDGLDANAAEANTLQVVGQVIAIEQEDGRWRISLLVDRRIVQMVVEQTVAEGFAVGDRVLLSSQIHNPTIQKILS